MPIQSLFKGFIMLWKSTGWISILRNVHANTTWVNRVGRLFLWELRSRLLKRFLKKNKFECHAIFSFFHFFFLSFYLAFFFFDFTYSLSVLLFWIFFIHFKFIFFHLFFILFFFYFLCFYFFSTWKKIESLKLINFLKTKFKLFRAYVTC